jgi:hypothetical protein
MSIALETEIKSTGNSARKLLKLCLQGWALRLLAGTLPRQRYGCRLLRRGAEGGLGWVAGDGEEA